MKEAIAHVAGRFRTSATITGATLVAWSALAWPADPTALPPTPPQDQGLPYTRSGHAAAMARIGGCIAIFPGSRYAFVYGRRVRLDDTVEHRAEAVLKGGDVYVPVEFASILSLQPDQIVTDVVPRDLASLSERWVFTITRPAATIPAHVATLTVESRPYASVQGLTKALGVMSWTSPQGLVLIGGTDINSEVFAPAVLDTIIAAFDTPEKYADPGIATRHIPILQRQGAWTGHAKATPDRSALLNGPEHPWPMVPDSAYRYDGLDRSLLGSALPPPGVYPRVLLSPADVPRFAQRLRSSKEGQMALIDLEHLYRGSWWNEKTPDGVVFAKLASGDLSGLTWDRKPGTPPSAVPYQFTGYRIGYLADALPSMAWYCLMMEDQARGRQVATAIASFLALREPLVDEWNAISDSEFGGTYRGPDGSVIAPDGGGSTTHWRGMHSVLPNMGLGPMLDFGGAFMSATQKDVARRVIAKATYGRRPYGQDGPRRFADTNWVSWDLPHFLALCTIEGLEGFDREGYASNREFIRAFCEFGIDPDGVLYESNAKAAYAIQQLVLAMVALARRDENLFGHPHFRNLPRAQAMMTSPTGTVIVNSGTQYAGFSRDHLTPGFMDAFKAFYPGERHADYFLGIATRPTTDYYRAKDTRHWRIDDFTSAADYAAGLPTIKGLRIEPRGAISLYETDFQKTARTDLGLPLDFNAPTHGVFSAYSGHTADAAWINMLVRPDHYLGGGHHHADAGMFHFSALGVDWFIEDAIKYLGAGRFHNQVLVDGISEPEGLEGVNSSAHQAAARYLGARIAPGASFAAADLVDAYSWRWMTQQPAVWSAAVQALPWELDPSDHIARYYAGTARYKMRPWVQTSNASNYIPTVRAPWNPMHHVFRTVGLVRGAHPYGLVIDDAKKDGDPHLYQWTALPNDGVVQVDVPGIPPGALALAQPGSPSAGSATTGPFLLVLPIIPAPVQVPAIQVESLHEPVNGKEVPYRRLTISQHGTCGDFRVLLLPCRRGEPLPVVTVDASGSNATIAYEHQVDDLRFSVGDDQRTRVEVRRSGSVLGNCP